MRPRAILIASVVGLAVLAAGAAASGSGRASHQGRDAVAVPRAGVADRPPALAAQKRRRKRCRICKKLHIPQGSGGQSRCGPPEFVDEHMTTGSSVIKLVTDQFVNPPPAAESAYTTTAGDLLVAAIMTQGATVTPPSGWHAVPAGDVSDGTGQRLQIFYTIPVPLGGRRTRFGPESHSFTSSAPQAMTGALIGVSGADQAQPIDVAAGAAGATPSASVTAPSITPSGTTTRLLFVGATGSQQTWTVPAGMKPLAYRPSGESGFGLASQWWRTAAATGTRTADISSAAASIAELIAVRFPLPTTCPKIRIVNRRDGKRLRFKASADGFVRVRLKCQWTERCKGALGLLVPVPVAAGSISVPAGKTRTVRIGVCKLRLRCAGPVPRGRSEVFVQVLLYAPNGQLVDATARRDDMARFIGPSRRKSR